MSRQVSRNLELPVAVSKRPTLQAVCASTDSIAASEVGLLNLLCAQDLPGSESLDIDKALYWLDSAAEKVDLEIRRHWYRFTESPAYFNNSPGYYCCYYLLQVLQEDCGVRYNPERVRDPKFQDPNCFDPDFRDSRDLFIHGIIDGPGGCCASMPVLYVAVGRRLGFPLFLVEARGHLFFRWEDPMGERFGVPERFNIEGAGYGIASNPDGFYKTWPSPLTDVDEAEGWYLKSMTPREELAAFLVTRSVCLEDNGRLAEAIQANQWAHDLLPNDLRYRNRLWSLQQQLLPPKIDVELLMQLNRANRERWLQQLPPGTGSSASPPEAPHGNSCQCAHCIEARRLAAGQTYPGHPMGCICHLCRPPHLNNAAAMNQIIPGQTQAPRIPGKDFSHVLPNARPFLVAGPNS